jgi:hypothetical protein
MKECVISHSPASREVLDRCPLFWVVRHQYRHNFLPCFGPRDRRGPDLSVLHEMSASEARAAKSGRNLKKKPSLRRRLAPCPFTPKAGVNGALAAAPSKPVFSLLGRKAAKRAQKFLCRTLRRSVPFQRLPRAHAPRLNNSALRAGDPSVGWPGLGLLFGVAQGSVLFRT